MSADSTAANPVGHDGGGGGGGADDAVGADGATATGGDRGGGGVATIDDAEAFHLKTVRVFLGGD